MSRLNPLGFLVIESCEDYEQVLSLDVGKDKPAGGILTWANGRNPRVFFPTRKKARDAITRTEHYRKAFGLGDPPEPKMCHIELLSSVED